MKYIALLLSVVVISLLFVTCDSDFEVNDKWEDIPVVYCVLDQSKPYQYIKVNKCFLGNVPASQMASVADSLFYDEDVKVYLHRKQGKTILKTWEFNPVDTIKKDDGYFGSEKNRIWIGTPDLVDGYTYEVEVNIGNGRKVATGEAELVNGIRISSPDSRAAKIEMSRYSNDFSVKYYPGNNGNVFQVTVNFNYLEIKTNGDTVPKSLQFYNSTSYKTNINSNSESELAFSVLSFYSSLVAGINKNDSTVVKRLVKMPDCMTFSLAAADENFYTYMQVTQPATGIAQDKPIFTNIVGGYGLMASRYNVALSKALGTESLDSISRGVYTSGLKFPGWYDNYYIVNKPYN